MNQNKNTLGIYLLLTLGTIAIVGTGIWFYLHPQKNTVTAEQAVAGMTADWQTYSNAEYGFEFKYPKNLFLLEKIEYPYYGQPENQAKDLAIYIDSTAFIPNSGLPQPLINLRIYSMHPALKAASLGEWLTTAQIEWNPGIAKNDLIPIKKIAVGGNEAYIHHQQITDGGTPPVTIFARNSDMIFQIEFDGDRKDLENQIDTILSTFRFYIPAPKLSNTSTWPIYTAPAFNLSIKYPDTFKTVSGESAIYGHSTNIVSGFMPQGDEYIPGEKIPKHLITIRKVSSQLSGSQPDLFQKLLIEDVYYDGSGLHPDSFDKFKKVTIGANMFYYIKTGLFEGQLGLRYYLANQYGIFSFDLVSNGVDWTNPSLDIEKDPGHMYLKQMLETVSFTQ